ncbi:protein SIEVE ELEMENT OCCLUSION B-like [Camellia sinensis]|uniref:protein SIEVE ELEMENT OCCLUSION B-like n=1 Tax=Camellia sinensis TaxID=4442 RepID=UPI0010368749|nr:protein SIEVE ELEMENT OCCLUSION B-like [Camellia sinensis]
MSLDRGVNLARSDPYRALRALAKIQARQVSSKCSRGSDAHTTTLALFNILSSYSWDAKVVIALAAFSINWGELWLVHQHYQFNPLAEYLTLFKQPPNLLKEPNSLKPTFEALTNLIKAMMDVTKCIVEFKKFPPQYITSNMPVMMSSILLVGHLFSGDFVPIFLDQDIDHLEETEVEKHLAFPSLEIDSLEPKGLVEIAGILVGLLQYIASTKEAKELSSLNHKVSNIYSHLQKQLTLCYQHIEEKKYNEAFQKLELLFETTHIDNINILKALVSAEEDQLPLFDGSTKRKVSIDVLRNKNVLLLISDLDLSNEEHFILLVIKYIKEVWHFNKKAPLVMLDPQGKVVHRNAIHVCWIWGNMAFPFTSLKEKELWKETRWTMEFLADSIDLSILDWIVDDKYICLYGGDDLEWIRRFTKTSQAVAATAHIQLEILYVGKSKARETVQKISNTILLEKLSHVLSDPTLVWFFWVRLESMWHSKRQLSTSVENDPIMQEIMTILSFDGNDQSWAVISRGTAEMAEAKGDTMLQSLVKFEEWKDHAKEIDNKELVQNPLEEFSLGKKKKKESKQAIVKFNETLEDSSEEEGNEEAEGNIKEHEASNGQEDQASSGEAEARKESEEIEMMSSLDVMVEIYSNVSILKLGFGYRSCVNRH